MEAAKYRFTHPARCVIAGPSGCGKTEFMQRVIRYRDSMFTEAPGRVIYTYKYPQAWFQDYPDIEFTRQIPKHLDPQTPSLVVIDDVVCDPGALKESASLFVRGSHHLNTSVFFITQNLFASSPDFRTISLNATQFVLFKTVRGKAQIEHLGRQIYNKAESREFFEVYKDATQDAYSYLLVDLSPEESYRLRTRIFPDEEEILYILEP